MSPCPRVLFCLLPLMVFLAPIPGTALTILFDGQIETINSDVPPPPEGYPIGTPFSGRIVYDETTIDSDPDSSRGFYSGAISIFEVSVGSDEFSATPGDIEIVPDFLDGFYLFATPIGPSLGAFDVSHVRLEFFDGSNVISTDALPDASTFATRLLGPDAFEINFSTGPSAVVDYEASNFNFTVIPEPSTAALLARGLVAMGARNRRVRS
jgi:hypothetical protein